MYYFTQYKNNHPILVSTTQPSKAKDKPDVKDTVWSVNAAGECIESRLGLPLIAAIQSPDPEDYREGAYAIYISKEGALVDSDLRCKTIRDAIRVLPGLSFLHDQVVVVQVPYTVPCIDGTLEDEGPI